MKTALYRHFDAHGVLLYVGISDALSSRTRDHVADAVWVSYAARGSVEWFATREEAEFAELAAIRSEGPVFNRAGGYGDRDARVHAYKAGRDATVAALIAHGRQQVRDELAARRRQRPGDGTGAPVHEDAVGLRQAWAEGLVGGGWEALRKAAQRSGFPAPIGQAARRALLYDRESLVAWWTEKVEKSPTAIGGDAQ